ALEEGLDPLGLRLVVLEGEVRGVPGVALDEETDLAVTLVVEHRVVGVLLVERRDRGHDVERLALSEVDVAAIAVDRVPRPNRDLAAFVAADVGAAVDLESADDTPAVEVPVVVAKVA